MRYFTASSASARAASILILLTFSVSGPFVSAAQAQTKARVLRDQTIIWKPGFTVAASVVKAGTVLTVVSRVGDWYEVEVPSGEGVAAVRGFIAVSRVELLPGSPAPPEHRPPTGTPRSAAPPATAPPPPAPPAVAVRGFGQIGHNLFNAHDTFNAVLDKGGGVFYGGGGEVRFRSFFVAGTVEYFKGTGQRAFVSDGKVYRLGIPDRISILPVTGTAGWRFNRRTAIPYVGAGVGRYRLKESSDFSDPSENVSATFTGWHIVGGVDVRGNSWVSTSFEVLYSHVPDALGVGGVSSILGEHDLGGVEFRVRVLAGR